MLLAGDVGGTKTLLGLFSAARERPRTVDVAEFVTLDHDGLEPMIESCLRSRKLDPTQIEAASFGVAAGKARASPSESTSTARPS